MSVSPMTNTLKRKIIGSLDKLPPEGLYEVETFLDYLRFKLNKAPSKTTPYRPVALGGQWKDESLSDQDIEDARKEMWQNFGKREP
jgi:hypothetical protein